MAGALEGGMCHVWDVVGERIEENVVEHGIVSIVVGELKRLAWRREWFWYTLEKLCVMLIKASLRSVVAWC